MKLPTGPKITMPKRGERRARPSQAAKRPRPSRVQAPGALNDLYRDMRDRRLIVPALALAAAIAAAPFALSASSEPAPGAQEPALGEGVTAVEPAVLAEDLSGVRNYRERLEELKNSNPFASKLEKPVKERSTEAGPGLAGRGGAAASPAPAPAPGANPGSGTGGGATPPASAPPVAEQVLLILAPRVDIRFGRGGKVREKDDVAPGDLIPKKGESLALMAVVSDDLKKVQFLIFDGFVALEGEGGCEPGRSQCDLLTLRKGERHLFRNERTGKRVSIAVSDITEEIVDRRKVADGG